MLSDCTDLPVRLCRICRVAVLQREPIGVVHKLLAVGDVVLEKTPEQIARDHGFGLRLLGFDDRVEAGEAVAAFEACPVVLPGEVDAVGGFDEGDVGSEFLDVGGVEVVGEDVDCGDGEVGFVDAVRAVYNQFLRG